MPSNTGPIGGGRRGAFGDVTAAQSLAEAESSRNPIGRSRVGVPTVATDDPSDLGQVFGFLGPFGFIDAVLSIGLRNELGLEQDSLSVMDTIMDALDIDPLAMLGLTDSDSPFSSFSLDNNDSAIGLGLGPIGNFGGRAAFGPQVTGAIGAADSPAGGFVANKGLSPDFGRDVGALMSQGVAVSPAGRSGGSMGPPPGGVHGPLGGVSTTSHSSQMGGLGGAGTGPGGQGSAGGGPAGGPAGGSAGSGGTGPGGMVGGAPAGASGVGGGFSGGASEGGVFMQGGYTGTNPQPGSQVMGRVHEGEYVIPRDVVETPLGQKLVMAAERQRRQNGGMQMFMNLLRDAASAGSQNQTMLHG